MVFYAKAPNVCLADFVSLMSTVANFTVGAGGVRRYPPSCFVDEYISRYVPHLDARRFVMKTVGQALTVRVGDETHKTACTGRRWLWEHCSGRRAANFHTPAAFMDMPIVRSFEEANYEAKLSELRRGLREENSVSTESSQSQRCGSDSLCDEWFQTNHEYGAKDIDFDVWLRRHTSQHRKRFVACHNVEVIGIVPQLRGERLISVPLWWLITRAVVSCMIHPRRLSLTSVVDPRPAPMLPVLFL